MALEITVPSFGESISESTVAAWLKNDGDLVARGEALVTLDTEKASSDVTAEAPGRLKILVPAGTDVKIGAVIGRIEESAEVPAGAPAPSAGQPAQPPATVTVKSAGPETGVPGETPSIPPMPASAETAPPPAEVVDRAAKFVAAMERVPAPAPAAVRAEDGRVTRQPMSRLRKTIAKHLLTARNETAMLTSFAEVDMTAVLALRSRFQDSFVKRHGIKLGFMSFFIKAAVDALRAIPAVNASIDGDDIVFHHFYDIGVAVSTDRGLVVPVIRDCDQKSFAEIEKELVDLANAARAGKLGLDQLKGGTFTITNGGVFGSMLSTPLLNPPQVGILGMHAITDRPMAVDGKVEIRPMMYLALSYDHRLIDGKEAVQFLVHLRDRIAAPERLLLGL